MLGYGLSGDDPFINNITHTGDEAFANKLKAIPGYSPGETLRNVLSVIGLINSQGGLNNVMNQPPTPPSPGNIWEDSGDSPTTDPFSSQGQNNTDAILQQLQQLQDPSRYMMNSDMLRQQALAAASMQYDPLIYALQQQMGQTQTRANRNSAILGSMFNQLGDSLQADVPKVQQQYTDAKNNVNQNYQNAQNQIADIYNQTNQQQQDTFNKLNIQAAASDVDPKQARDQAFLKGIVADTNNTAQAALNQEQQGAVNYSQQGAESARREGTQRQADLMTQLGDYLNQAQGQIGEYGAEKQTAAANNLYQLMTQNQSLALQRAQQDFNNYISSINVQRNLSNDQLNQLKTLAGLQNMPVQDLSQVGRRAMQLGLPQNSAQNIQNIMNQSILSDQVSGGTTGLNLTPEAKAAQILEIGKQQGLNNAELNALQDIALEYFGRR